MIKQSNNQLWLIYLAVCLCVFIGLCVRLWPLLPLYISADVRANVRTSIEHVTQEKGWLTSGVSVREIGDGYATFSYRHYHRGRDEVECADVVFSDFSSLPCKR